MQAGKLRKKLLIQAPDIQSRPDGSQEVLWHTLHDVYGEVRPRVQQEQVIAGQDTARTQHVITLRFLPDGLPPTYQIVLKGTSRVFEPTGVLNIDERNRELRVLAIEKVPQNARND